MILNPFDVVVGRRAYTFIDRLAIDSPIEHNEVQTLITASLMAAQRDAMCAALGITDTEPIPNFGFGVYDGSTRVGIYLMAANQYISGPWEDVIDWAETSNDPAIIHGRHMPSFGGLSTIDEQALAAETTWHFLSKKLATTGGHELAFERISWAIFEERTDPNSVRTKGMHDRVVADPRLEATVVPDGTDPELSRVDVELK